MSVSDGELLVGGGVGLGWWLVVDHEDGEPLSVVDGPFPDETDACWAALNHADHPNGTRSVFGIRREDGSLLRRPSPRERRWLVQLETELGRLPAGWDTGLPDRLVTLVVQVAAGLCEAGLPLDDGTSTVQPGRRAGGVCLTPDVGQGGVIVSWGQHDPMSINRTHGADAWAAVQQAMNLAVAQVLATLALPVEPFPGGAAHIVRLTGS